MLSWIMSASLGFAGDIFEPKSTGDESYAETFTAFADFDDGSYACCSLFTNAGFGTEKPDAVVIGPKGMRERTAASMSAPQTGPAAQTT